LYLRPAKLSPCNGRTRACDRERDILREAPIRRAYECPDHNHARRREAFEFDRHGMWRCFDRYGDRRLCDGRRGDDRRFGIDRCAANPQIDTHVRQQTALTSRQSGGSRHCTIVTMRRAKPEPSFFTGLANTGIVYAPIN
jgi:hypothetical protein